MRFVRVRWFCALVSLLFSIWLMVVALKINGIGAAGPVLFSLMAFLSAILLIVPETVFRAAEWISRPFADLFYPSEEFKKPPLSYVLARRYSNERRLEDAVAEYEKIIHYYPKEQAAYVELLAVLQRLGAGRLYDKYAHMLKHRFHQDAPPFSEPDDQGCLPPTGTAEDDDSVS